MPPNGQRMTCERTACSLSTFSTPLSACAARGTRILPPGALGSFTRLLDGDSNCRA